MVEPIPSAVKFGDVRTTVGDRPRHTDVDHESCAYYVDGASSRIFCPHGNEAEGAFYSEDYLWEIRTTTHRMITAIRSSNFPINRSAGQLMIQLEKLTK